MKKPTPAQRAAQRPTYCRKCLEQINYKLCGVADSLVKDQWTPLNPNGSTHQCQKGEPTIKNIYGLWANLTDSEDFVEYRERMTRTEAQNDHLLAVLRFKDRDLLVDWDGSTSWRDRKDA